MIKSMYTVRFSINNQTIMKGVFMATMPLRKYIHIIAFFLLPLSMMGEEDSFTEEAFRYTIIGEDRVEISSTENDSTFIQSQQDRILVIPHSVLHKGHSFIVVRISENAFSMNCNVEKLEIEEGVEAIGEGAFMFCPNLKAITIPASVKSIGRRAFTFCENIEMITVDSENTVYDSRDGCNAIITANNTLILGCRTTIIPPSVRAIGEDAFTLCRGLKTVSIPEGIENVASYAFNQCAYIESVSIPSTVTLINAQSFHLCDKLKEIEVNKDNDDYDSRNGCNAIISTEDNCLVMGCQSTIIPNSVTTIGSGAFMDCVQLEELNISEGVTEIEDAAFLGCVKLRKVSLPASLKTFSGYGHFGRCFSLDSIYIPKGVSEIPGNIFLQCSSLERIVVDPMNKVYDSRKECNGIVEIAQDRLVAGCRKTSIVEGIKEIGKQAFNHIPLKEIEIPASVTYIDSTAFCGSKSYASISVNPQNKVYDSRNGCNAIIETATNTLVLGNVTTDFPNGITRIGHRAFMSTPSILSLPDGIIEIASEAFAECDELREITLPESVKKIGRNAFADCTQLRVALLMSPIKIAPYSIFRGCEKLYKISFPKGNGSVAATNQKGKTINGPK